MTQRICIVGGGIGGLGAACTLLRHPNRFDVHVFEKNDRLGGNAVTVDIPQAEGPPVPIDISVTAFIPSVYQNYMELMKLCGIEHVPTRFSYTVHYDGGVYAHDFASPLKDELRGEIRQLPGSSHVPQALPTSSTRARASPLLVRQSTGTST